MKMYAQNQPKEVLKKSHQGLIFNPISWITILMGNQWINIPIKTDVIKIYLSIIMNNTNRGPLN